MAPPQRQTKDDKQLTASVSLYDLAERLLDSKQVLEDIHSIFQDDEASDRSKENYLLALRKTVIPLLQFAADTIRSSTKLVAPIPGSQYVHKRNEIKKRASVSKVTPTSNVIWGQTISRKSEPLRRIEDTLTTEKVEIKKRKAWEKEEIKKRKAISRTPLPARKQPKRHKSHRPGQALPIKKSQSVAIAPPADGKCYSREETARILLAVDGTKRNDMMDQWIQSGTSHFQTRRTLQ